MERNALTSAYPGGLSTEHRRLLSRLNRETHGVFSIDEAAAILALDRSRVARLLPYFARRGWLKRVKSGLYITVPLEATEPESWTEDSWVVVSRVFQPAYIGGWSAANHWGLTEQLFRTVTVYTQKPIRERQGEVLGVPYRAHRIRAERFFGTSPVWRGRTRVEVSDPARTVVDVLDDPSFGGGIRHVAQIVDEYFSSSSADDALLLDYAECLGNRAVYKRLGYLIGRLGIERPDLVKELLRRRSRGIVLLDQALPPSGKINSRWEIDENVNFEDLP